MDKLSESLQGGRYGYWWSQNTWLGHAKYLTSRRRTFFFVFCCVTQCRLYVLAARFDFTSFLLCNYYYLILFVFFFLCHVLGVIFLLPWTFYEDLTSFYKDNLHREWLQIIFKILYDYLLFFVIYLIILFSVLDIFVYLAYFFYFFEVFYGD